jgi:hypothetical protein
MTKRVALENQVKVARRGWSRNSPKAWRRVPDLGRAATLPLSTKPGPSGERLGVAAGLLLRASAEPKQEPAYRGTRDDDPKPTQPG